MRCLVCKYAVCVDLRYRMGRPNERRSGPSRYNNTTEVSHDLKRPSKGFPYAQLHELYFRRPAKIELPAEER